MSAAVHLDLTEIVSNPVRSGIQRVEREAIRHWEGPRPVPCVVDGDGRLRRLRPETLDLLCAEDDGSAAARDAERRTLIELREAGEPMADRDVGRLLNLELFFDPVRADAHLRLAASGTRVMWYLYDFLPFLRPDLFPPGTPRHCMHFLRGVRAAGDRLSFLSFHTREEFGRRVARRAAPGDGWPVFDPGADGLGLEQQVFSPARRDFVAIGTSEPRKNSDALAAAFEMLWGRGVDARLVLAGHVSPQATGVRTFLERHAGDPRLIFLDRPSDDALRAVLRRARAVVMPSENEGFGLPPYEALQAGIPAIASARVPSAALMPAGAALLPRMDAPSIAAMVEMMLDDAVAARMWSEAAALELPRWRDFGRRLADWAREA